MLKRLSATIAACILVLAAPVRAEVEIQEIVSPGGIAAWLAEERSIPFVALELRFLGGAVLDEPGREGAVALMTYLLEEGAGARDASAFAEAREALAAQFSFDVGHDSVSVSAMMLTENRDAATELLREALVSPRFDDVAVERVRAQLLASLRSDARRPESIAFRTFDALAFGAHPYARASDGREETVAALTRDDLVAAHARALVRDRVRVAAVGDISAEELGLLLDRLLGDLPLSDGAALPAATVGLEPGLTVVPFDGPQSVIVFGHAGIPRDDPDFLPAFVVNEVLGGGRFGSRLMESVREERGLTYGVYSWLASRQLGATMQGQLSTSHHMVPEAIALIRAEWARMAAEGLNAAETEAIVTFLTGEYSLRFESNAGIAGIMVGMQMQGLPSSYVFERNDLVRALSPERLSEVAARLLDPEALHFVVVGQPEGLSAAN